MVRHREIDRERQCKDTPDRKKYYGSRVGGGEASFLNVVSCKQANALFSGNGPKPVKTGRTQFWCGG
ncbi:hypothetical protein DPMN_189253 [Dreissena polymorpha]|uniref:Uncharacterized protein n=1 Tax=Dreissena polymorpha TaxID=45954 RepID=A0A9D4DTS8_DREPO|nr:hypothetical protein DPMN_189253 [Dreissena polymorpha]